MYNKIHGGDIMKSEENNKNTFKKVVFWVSFAIFLVGLACILFLLFNTYLFPKEYKPTPVVTSNVSSESELPDNPINFSAEVLKYPDIYAWIEIPNTKINYPVVQSPTDDGYYLSHNAEKQYTKAGAIYSEMRNSKDFSDPNTVLYGHNLLNGTMFRDLHKFRNDETFWNENKYIYIYIPGHILTYEICSAYRYDNRHILNSFNFSIPQERIDFFSQCVNPTSLVRQVASGMSLTAGDKIITLSTCTSNDSERYLVVGKLISDTKTK